MRKQDLHRISDYIWELPRDTQRGMHVPARIYADDELLSAALLDHSVEQLVNTATLPGVVRYTLAMPDIHQGYGFPIGGVVATRLDGGVVSPGGVGYDINCGVRLLVSRIRSEEAHPFLKQLADVIAANCPSGTGARSRIKLSRTDEEEILIEGAQWALRHEYGDGADLERTEECGRVADADSAHVSDKAKERGLEQMGTVGAGNHFIEIDRVAEVFNESAGARLALFVGNVAVQIHCGSRGFGHQVCQDYVSRFQAVVQTYGITLPDRELVCAPCESPEAKQYFGAMAAAANYAFANRQMLAYAIRHSFEQVLAGKVQDFSLTQVYDVAHNMAKVEDHSVEGQSIRLCVHRKGATRAFGPEAPGIPHEFADLGQPVLIPGSMGTESYVLLGTAQSMEQTFGSCCHGAGRVWSRTRARQFVRGERLRNELQSRGIVVRAGSMRDFAEETPEAYKDVSRVVETVVNAGLAKKVARLEPIAVIKG